MAQDYELTKHVLRLNERNEIVETGAVMTIASIDDFLKQRVERLEALKSVKKSLGHMMHPNQKAEVAATITKAEAAE